MLSRHANESGGPQGRDDGLQWRPRSHRGVKQLDLSDGGGYRRRPGVRVGDFVVSECRPLHFRAVSGDQTFRVNEPDLTASDVQLRVSDGATTAARAFLIDRNGVCQQVGDSYPGLSGPCAE